MKTSIGVHNMAETTIHDSAVVYGKLSVCMSVCYVFDLNGKCLGKLLFLGGCTSTRSSSGIEPDHH